MGFDGGVEGKGRFWVLRTAQEDLGQGCSWVIHFSARQSEDTWTWGGPGYEKRHRKGGGVRSE